MSTTLAGAALMENDECPRGEAYSLGAGSMLVMHPLDALFVRHYRDPHAQLDALLAYLHRWIARLEPGGPS